jgi:uncharacterized protein (DUF58 family)
MASPDAAGGVRVGVRAPGAPAPAVEKASPRRRFDPVSRLREAMARRFAAWLATNHPPRPQVDLTQRNVFIFPTHQGLGLALVIGMLIIGAINYQNSLIYLLAFLLGGMFIGCILFTFRNLAGLRMAIVRAQGCHAGEHAQFELRIEALDGRPHYGVVVGWPDEEHLALDMEGGPLTLSLAVAARHRGRLRPGRMLIESCYPMGLLRAWSWVDFGSEVIVYPQPLSGPLPPDVRADDSTLSQQVRADGDDFYGLRDYRVGDVPRTIAWKHFAASGQLRTKEFASGAGSVQRWLDWDDLAGVRTEERLRRLAGWVLLATRAERPFGVRIPGARFEPDTGDAHRVAVLTALALFGEPGQGGSGPEDAATVGATAGGARAW